MRGEAPQRGLHAWVTQADLALFASMAAQGRPCIVRVRHSAERYARAQSAIRRVQP